MPDGFRGESFEYRGHDTDRSSGVFSFRYRIGGQDFTEIIRIHQPTGQTGGEFEPAATVVDLLAGVSYYKTRAPARIDLGDLSTTTREREILREYYLKGLGEFAARNRLNLDEIEIVGPDAAGPSTLAARSTAASPDTRRRRPLIPFGGGIDSIVTVEHVKRRFPDAALFVVARPDDRFDAIEAPAAVTGLPMLRADRTIDPVLFESGRRGWFNGHVPVTGIISAIAVLAAVIDGRTEVVMSNEASASVPTRLIGDREVNHQYSKSARFERLFRDLLRERVGATPDYFSWLRDRSELWVAREFARLPQYWSSFRSCNRSFRLDPALRLDHWCGECDKCCFIDLILSPFMAAADLREVFGGNEPLENNELIDAFRRLVGTAPGEKPWECVGDELECRAAVTLAARRADRSGNSLLNQLAAEAGPVSDDAIGSLLNPTITSYRPAGYALDAVLG